MLEAGAAIVASQARQDAEDRAPLLQVEDLRVHYASTAGPYRVVDGSTMTINRHELFVLADESGCGKSTLVEGILPLIKPPGYLPTSRRHFLPPQSNAATPVDQKP